MRLGERLEAIANFVPNGAYLADIGTDHAYLPIYLIQTGKISRAIAGEVHRGPFLSAKETIEGLGLQQQLMLRFGDGVSILTPGEVDTVVIAGMGGVTIIEILSEQLAITQSLSRLILQPMIAAPELRKWLVLNNWNIRDEALVIEDGHLYEIIMAEQGTAAFFEPILYEIGPVLWAKKPPLLTLHMEHLLLQTRRVLQEMAISDKARNSAKYSEYREKVQQLEDKQACL